MIKRDLILLIVAPIVLLAVAFDLLWLAGRLHDGAERRLADYAVLQERVSTVAGRDDTSRSSQRAALTLARLAVEGHESDVATVTVATSLAVLLLAVSLLQVLTVLRLFRNQLKPGLLPRSEITTTKNLPPLRPSGVGAARSGLTKAGNHTLL